MRNKIFLLGLFVSAGILLFIGSIYMIGSKKNLFSSSINLVSVFKDVNGLQEGNEVRFRGISIGTVEKIEIGNDSSITVLLSIEKSMIPFIKHNSIANLGTDGLMGNKLITLKTLQENSRIIRDGDTLQAINPIESEQVFRSMSATGENMKGITANLLSITDRFNRENNFWNILSDSNLPVIVKTSLLNIKLISARSAKITANLEKLTNNMNNGKGIIGELSADTTFSTSLKEIIVNLQGFSDTAAILSSELSGMVHGLKKGNGPVGALLQDTSFVRNLNKSMENISKGSVLLNQDLEGLQHSFLLRRYFRKKEKKDSINF